ncbi:MAG TPA: C4-type zinc ribbon domain-containing protein [Candidatus Saccharimonadales bacterium]|nr:C4-type zinc ribbon domain-containing protein [Candidatus Saccharimonadales bacterium]
MSRASVLLRLQQTDDHIAQLQSEIAGVESALRGDAELDRLRTAESAAQESHRDIGTGAGIAELEAASLQTRIREMDRRLYSGSIHNPAELMELQRELDVLRVKLAVAEDDALARMEQVDAAKLTLRDVSALVAAREAQRASAMGPLRARLDTLTEQLAASNADRVALAAEAERADLSLYERITSHRRPAVTGVVGESCGGCRMPISNEERRAVRTGTGLTQCANCDRILAP